MTAVLARDLGETLYELIADLEPARWRDDKRRELREAFNNLKAELEGVLGQWPDGELAPVRSRLDEIRSILQEHTPSANDIQTRWMEFRGEIHAAYEGLAEALKSAHMELPSVRPTNYVRSSFHVLSGFIALLFVEYSPWWLVIAVPASLAAVAWSLEIGRRFSERWNELMMRVFAHVAHPHERYRVNSSTWFCTALTLLALTGEPIAAAMAVTVLGLGDPAAALVGRRWGRTKLVNNRSLEGTVTFAVVSLVACMLVLFGWHADLSLANKAIIAGAASLTGALVELFSRRIDDNLAIPVLSGAAAWFALMLV